MNAREALYYNFGADSPTSRGYRNQFLYYASNVPIIGDIARAYDNWNYLNDYMTARGVTWDDVKYPTRVGQSYSAVPNFVSSNIEKLYS